MQLKKATFLVVCLALVGLFAGCNSGIPYRPDLKLADLMGYTIEMSSADVTTMITTAKDYTYINKSQGINTPPVNAVFFRTSLAGSPAYGVEKLASGDFQYVIFGDDAKPYPWTPEGKAAVTADSPDNKAPVVDFFAGRGFVSLIAAASYSPIYFSYGPRLFSIVSIMVDHYVYQSPDVVINDYNLGSLTTEMGGYTFVWDGNWKGDIYAFPYADGKVDTTKNGFMIRMGYGRLWLIKIVG